MCEDTEHDDGVEGKMDELNTVETEHLEEEARRGGGGTKATAEEI